MCDNNKANRSCEPVSTTRQVTSVIRNEGKNGESAYETYVRLGGMLSEEEWANAPIESIPTFSNQGFDI